MRAPGEEVILGERPAARAGAPSTSAGFLAGFTEKGRIDEPEYCVSMTHLEEFFGGRLDDHPELFDAADAAFHEALGMGIYVQRLVHTGAVAASKVLVDEAGKTVFTAQARSVGEYGNSFKVKVVKEGAEFKIVVETTAGKLVEASPLKTTKAALLEWGQNDANTITLISGESAELPKVQTVTLAGGNAKLAEVVGADVVEGLANYAEDLGPGQLALPNFAGEEEAQIAALGHCALSNRRALLDDELTAEVADLIEHATALSVVDDDGARYGALFGSWAIIPGLTSQTSRTCPYSGVQMGLIARSESEGNNPNKPAAGRKRGKVRWALGLVTTFTKEERAELSAAGVTTCILDRGVPVTFDDRTLVDQTTDEDWISFASSRTVMAVYELTRQVLEGFEFEDIDGHGYVFGELAGEIGARACKPLYNEGALYGESPEEAFAVNTGPEVNTPASIEAEEIKAQVAIRCSKTGRFLKAEIVRVPVSEAVA